MNSFLVGITTYNRPKSCLTLLKQVQHQADTYSAMVRLVVVDDSSTVDYSAVKTFCHAHRATAHFHQKEHGGKCNYWSAVNIVMSAAWMQRPAFTVLVQDDIEICQAFFQRLNQAHSTARSAGINLHIDSARANASVWGEKPSSGVFQPALPFGGLRQINWLDCLWSMPLSALERLDYRVQPITTEDPSRGSGVGRQLTHRLRAVGVPVYQPLKSLVRHLEGPSLMHPKLRGKTPLHTVNFIDDNKG